MNGDRWATVVDVGVLLGFALVGWLLVVAVTGP